MCSRRYADIRRAVSLSSCTMIGRLPRTLPTALFLDTRKTIETSGTLIGGIDNLRKETAAMSMARKFKRQAAKSQPKTDGPVGDTSEGAEAPEAPKAAKPTPPAASFNMVQKPVHPTGIPRTQ